MNTCKFCGAQLNGTEAVCPNCGNQVTNINANTSQPAMPGIVEQPVAPVEQPVTPVEQPVAPVEQPVAPEVAPAVQPVAPMADPMIANPI